MTSDYIKREKNLVKSCASMKCLKNCKKWRNIMISKIDRTVKWHTENKNHRESYNEEYFSFLSWNCRKGCVCGGGGGMINPSDKVSKKCDKLVWQPSFFFFVKMSNLWEVQWFWKTLKLLRGYGRFRCTCSICDTQFFLDKVSDQYIKISHWCSTFFLPP